MFHNIPTPLLDRMRELELRDAADRTDGTPHLSRLRQIPPQTGRFLALMCAGAPPGAVLEIGTSAGYSALWLWLACRERGDRLTTFEVLEEKVALAQETFETAGVSQQVQLIHGDARQMIGGYAQVAFCFLDAEKDIYLDCYELLIPNLVAGGLLVVDNILSHAAELEGFVTYAQHDPRVDTLLVPIGKGLMVCRKSGSSGA